jgi:diaminohydroxyphosphoribosylaminopyrimidine deaminase/5-amino-6-(5-phosphoribosylamino)uracil reductase
MALAIEEMQLSSGRGPKVGAVLAKDGRVLSKGHRQTNLHAERDALQKAISAGMDVRGSTIYTTLEPCVNLGSKHESCADLIIRSGITSAAIGRYDTNPRIYREGWKKLRDGGLTLRDFDADLRSQIDQINATFAEHFVSGVGPTGGAEFDYLLNGGNFEIQFSEEDERSIVTRWSLRSDSSVHAYANRPLKVALARHAREFSEIDDPTAFDFDYHAPIKEGEIAVFVNESGAVLVKVIEVHGGPERGATHTSVKIKFEVRPQ